MIDYLQSDAVAAHLGFKAVGVCVIIAMIARGYNHEVLEASQKSLIFRLS
ncbi:hypothetical protein ALO90_200170 [Pseudomonas amygdali pv. aesculi]|nr:hypothetical protein ALO90_200170 [Pseudomonas amygdali pv. aesculi]